MTATNNNGESGTSNQAAVITLGTGTGSAGHFVYTLNSQWNNGVDASIIIHNLAGAAIAGSNVVLTIASWNSSVAPGSTISGVDFNASYSATNTSPAAFFLNGTA